MRAVLSHPTRQRVRSGLSIGWRRLPSAATIRRLIRLFLLMSADNQLTLIEIAEGFAHPAAVSAPAPALRVVARLTDPALP